MNAWVRHLLRLPPVLLGTTALTFVLIDLLPGDPVPAMLGEQAAPAQIAALREQLGLERPVLLRYFDWLGSALTGDLARSLMTRESVAEAVLQRLPVALKLMLLAQATALLVGLPLGVLAAWRRDGVLDRLISAGAYGLLSTPVFILAMVLIYVVAVRLGWLPATGYTAIGTDLGANLRSMVLPALVLAAAPTAIYTRLVRSDMIATLQEDFILLAKAQGHSVAHILLRQALRPSLLPMITVFGINTGVLMGGAVIIEHLFALPGMGSLMVEAILSRDYPLLQGVVLCIAVAFCLVNLLVDMAYLLLDPRMRHG
ncbi:ABC transporter permease [Verminephrobacter eiseniae]|uniref:ABC transporter permease n=1 Tax=Verminephrobacter eiseniae TaxID=364317 RepID=UPI002237D5FD|nr:ABC transporter permease [Verminephrobacter eiseniae]MCW5236596.1 ABC transporter permease [Verminephrobacter eiseniae]